ncbi:hypothetical protein GYMLUDRAFT_161129 [Collybiopsis luxurians FD-317 M1]|nr:hypothetical protein GYMLUDRAFT_161129 [Collybiopsis luxurians FD-317 M1]
MGFIFQCLIRRWHFSWWMKYNYVLSAVLDSGLAMSVVVIYFTYVSCSDTRQGCSDSILLWWGNTVFLLSANGQGIPVLNLPISSAGTAKVAQPLAG